MNLPTRVILGSFFILKITPSAESFLWRISAFDASAPARMERILAVSEAAGGKLALNLNTDGKLYIAVHSGHGFFDTVKGKEAPAELRARFTREIKWFTDTIDAFLLN